MRHRFVPALVVAAALVAAAGLIAGPLTPPAGPVAGTYKTLSEVEPRTAINAANTPGDATSLFKITQPGSYYLTGNITAVSGKNGILVACSDVSIDLCGFALTGVPGSLSGVFAPNQAGISVSNGAVVSWGGNGVTNYNGTGARFTGLTAIGNNYGIIAGTTSLIQGCVAKANTGVGITADNFSVVSGCTASDNSLDGIGLGNGTKADHCTSAQNGSNGFATADNATVSECLAYANTLDGFRMFWSCTVTSCVAESNSQNGVSFGANCVLTGNSARLNAAAGLYGPNTSVRCCLRGNDCNNNGTGIRLDGASNLVMGNTAGGNTSLNYQMVAGNRVGAINVMPLSAAISGSTGGTSGTVDPASNFAY